MDGRILTAHLRLLVPGEGSINSPYDDPNSPLPFEPIEKDQPMKPWKAAKRGETQWKPSYDYCLPG